MKELIFVRHAKSDWGSEGLRDIDRCLSERGYNDAYAMSKWFTENKKTPQRILSSSATRALSTAFIFMREMDFHPDHFTIEAQIYESTDEHLLNLVKHLKDDVKSVMLFGHNPGFTNACNALSKELYFDNIPTCGMVALSFEADKWKDIKSKSGTVLYHQFPKEYKNKS